MALYVFSTRLWSWVCYVQVLPKDNECYKNMLPSPLLSSHFSSSYIPNSASDLLISYSFLLYGIHLLLTQDSSIKLELVEKSASCWLHATRLPWYLLSCTCVESYLCSFMNVDYLSLHLFSLESPPRRVCLLTWFQVLPPNWWIPLLLIQSRLSCELYTWVYVNIQLIFLPRVFIHVSKSSESRFLNFR